VIIVEFDTAMERQAVLDLQFDIDRARRLARDERRRNLPVGKTVRARQIGLEPLEVERLPAFDGAHLAPHQTRAVVLDAADRDLPDRHFGHC